MDKEGFKEWLQERYKEDTISSRMSNCDRVEKYEGDLDIHFNKDKLEKLTGLLTYSKDDQRSGKEQKHKVPIDGNIYNGTATLKRAVKLYREFRLNPNPNFKVINIHKQTTKKKKTKQNSTWPEWPQPTKEELLKLAKIIMPFVKFLKPEIIHEITKDNRKHRDKWSCKLQECGINPDIYLWDGSPCAFPGIRRYSGSKEISGFRRKSTPDKPPPNCLATDDNSFPKQLWAFVFTGREFRNRGPKEYHLAHIFDHKNKNQKGQENHIKDVERFGLFTSPANTAYVLASFIKFTDFSHKVRILLQQKAFELYGNVCQILPPRLKMKACDGLDIKEIRFCECVGDMKYVSDFLKFRQEKMNELFKEFHNKWLHTA